MAFRLTASEQRALEAEAEAEALRIARKLSSGPYSTAALRRMGHPYATRNPRPPLPPYVVNVQTGRFRRGWRAKATLQGGRLVVELTNTSPEAKLLFAGTRKMIPRPIERRVKDELSSALPRLMTDLLGR